MFAEGNYGGAGLSDFYGPNILYWWHRRLRRTLRLPELMQQSKI
jgi:hypothetical protein